MGCALLSVRAQRSVLAHHISYLLICFPRQVFEDIATLITLTVGISHNPQTGEGCIIGLSQEFNLHPSTYMTLDVVQTFV